MRKGDCAREGIERRAERTNDVYRFVCWSGQLIRDGNGIIAFDGLAQIARGSQMVVHSSIDDEKFLPT